MSLLLTVMALLAHSATVPPPAPADWPVVPAGRVKSTPNWSDYNIYPAEAQRKEHEGEVIAELLVGTNGTPRQCRIARSSGFADLDTGTCDLMLRMRFEPARNEQGQPVASRFVRRIGWALTDPRPFASSRVQARLEMAGGTATSCKVLSAEGPYAALWSMLACSAYADLPHLLGNARSNGSGAIVVESRLDARDGAALVQAPWPADPLLSVRTVRFGINREGDASSCQTVQEQGFGARGLNNLSPCGKLLSSIWFEGPVKGAPERTGMFVTRVYSAPDGR